MQRFSGVPVSPGIAIGPVFVLESEACIVAQRPIAAEDVPSEIDRFRTAVSEARAEVERMRERMGVGPEVSAIFSSHEAVLEDRSLHTQVESAVTDLLVAAESAVAHVFDGVIGRFESMEEQFFAQRASDFRDIEQRLLRALLGDRQEKMSRIEGGAIVVAHDLTPTQAATLDQTHTLGFVTDVGGPTSHTAIIARSLSLPAVVGFGDITSRVRDGTLLIVNGNQGVVIVDPDEAQVEQHRRLALGHERYLRELSKFREYPAETLDGHVIQLCGNIRAAGEVAAVIEAGGDGVGLFRTEFLVQPNEPVPTEDDHFEAYVGALRELGGRPLTIRTFDFGADKYTPDGAAQAEPNPFLGARSIRLCLERPSLFMPQLRAILRASGHGVVRCLFPMISSLSELRRAKEFLEKARVQLRTEGHYVDERLPVGVMVEIPSAAIIADLLIEEVDFLSIGTNDLVQYTLAVDRINERVAHLYQPAHPALLRLIRMVVKVANEHGKSVSLCGEMAGDMLYTVLLVGMGIRELSLPPRALGEVKRVIRSITVEQSREAAAWCLEASDSSQVQARLRDTVSDLVPQLF